MQIITSKGIYSTRAAAIARMLAVKCCFVCFHFVLPPAGQATRLRRRGCCNSSAQRYVSARRPCCPLARSSVDFSLYRSPSCNTTQPCSNATLHPPKLLTAIQPNSPPPSLRRYSPSCHHEFADGQCASDPLCERKRGSAASDALVSPRAACAWHWRRYECERCD